MASDVRKSAQEQAENTFKEFIDWSKVVGYCILAFIVLLAFLNFGVDGSGSKYNGEVYSPTNITK